MRPQRNDNVLLALNNMATNEVDEYRTQISDLKLINAKLQNQLRRYQNLVPLETLNQD